MVSDCRVSKNYLSEELRVPLLVSNENSPSSVGGRGSKLQKVEKFHSVYMALSVNPGLR